MDFNRVLAYLLVAVGAFTVYSAKNVFKRIKGAEPGEKELVYVKLVGLAVALAGMVILFYI